jgi:hypothetical protein
MWAVLEPRTGPSSSKTLFLGLVLAWALQPAGLAARLNGVVLNAETGTPMGKVTVYLASSPFRAITGETGRFEIGGIPAGQYTLLATAVGYGLVKQSLTLAESEEVELEIILTAGTQISHEITVSAEGLSSRPELSQSEIHELKSVFVDDIFRAIQQLPGVASSDDFNSGFAVQGSGFDRVGLLFDGIPVYALLHTVQGQSDTGSTSVLSAELMEEVDLVPSASSAQMGNSSGGFLRLRSRSGNETRWRNLVSVSGSAFMGISEGPLGNGSWIASMRKSYVDWIVKRIEPDAEMNFGYHDIFAKVVQRPGRKDSISLRFFHGNTGQENVQENLGQNTVERGRFKSSLLHLEWSRAVNERLDFSTHAYWQGNKSFNRNLEGKTIWSNEQQVAGVRAVTDFSVTSRLLVSAGFTAEDWNGSNCQDYYNYRTRHWETLSEFEAGTGRQELFAQSTFAPVPLLSLTAGVNWNRMSIVDGVSASPFVAVELKPRNHALMVSFGEAHQFPFLIQMFGQYGNPKLRAETARVLQGAWVYGVSKSIELKVSGYNRRRDGVPWKSEGQWRLTPSGITPPSPTPFDNLLKDRSKGAEASIGRRATSGLAGWIGYGWGQSQWSEKEAEWFPGNYDQRHAISLFAQYRWSSQVDVSVKWKLATGMPIPAYADYRGDTLWVAPFRNLARLPNYSRLDWRMAKSFNRDRYRMTLFFEVLNLANRDNVRFTGVGLDHVNLQSGRVSHMVHTQLPILPTAGLAVEF